MGARDLLQRDALARDYGAARSERGIVRLRQSGLLLRRQDDCQRKRSNRLRLRRDDDQQRKNKIFEPKAASRAVRADPDLRGPYLRGVQSADPESEADRIWRASAARSVLCAVAVRAA